METINTSTAWKKSNKLRNVAIIATMFLALTSCTSKEKQYENQLQKVHKLENKVNGLQSRLIEQSNNYEMVSIDENIQQDLKRDWADASINQEIWDALNRASEQDERIAKTKEELANTQTDLFEAREKLATLEWELKNYRHTQEKRQDTRLNPGKYGYIEKELKKGHNN